MSGVLVDREAVTLSREVLRAVFLGGEGQELRTLAGQAYDALAKAKGANSGPRYAPSDSFKADVAAAFKEANSGRRQLAELHRLAVEASRTDSTGSAVRHARDELVRVCLSLGGEG